MTLRYLFYEITIPLYIQKARRDGLGEKAVAPSRASFMPL